MFLGGKEERSDKPALSAPFPLLPPRNVSLALFHFIAFVQERVLEEMTFFRAAVQGGRPFVARVWGFSCARRGAPMVCAGLAVNEKDKIGLAGHTFTSRPSIKRQITKLIFCQIVRGPVFHVAAYCADARPACMASSQLPHYRPPRLITVAFNERSLQLELDHEPQDLTTNSIYFTLA